MGVVSTHCQIWQQMKPVNLLSVGTQHFVDSIGSARIYNTLILSFKNGSIVTTKGRCNCLTIKIIVLGSGKNRLCTVFPTKYFLFLFKEMSSARGEACSHSHNACPIRS